MCKNNLSLESEEIDEDDSLSLNSVEDVSKHLDDDTNFQGRGQGGVQETNAEVVVLSSLQSRGFEVDVLSPQEVTYV